MIFDILCINYSLKNCCRFYIVILQESSLSAASVAAAAAEPGGGFIQPGVYRSVLGCIEKEFAPLRLSN